MELKKENARIAAQKKLRKQLHKELKAYLKARPALTNLLTDVAEKSDFVDFEPSRTLSCCRAPSDGWCGYILSQALLHCSCFCCDVTLCELNDPK